MPSFQQLRSAPVQRCVNDYLSSLFAYFTECSLRQGGLCVDLNDIRFEQIPTSPLNKHIHAVLEEKSRELSAVFRDGFFYSFIEILNDTVNNFNSNRYYQKLRAHAPDEWAGELTKTVYDAGLSVFKMVSLKKSHSPYSPEGIIRFECAKHLFPPPPELKDYLEEFFTWDKKLLLGALATTAATVVVWKAAKLLLNCRVEEESFKSSGRQRNRYNPPPPRPYKAPKPLKTTSKADVEQSKHPSLPRVSSSDLREMEAEKKKQEVLEKQRKELEREWERARTNAIKAAR